MKLVNVKKAVSGAVAVGAMAASSMASAAIDISTEVTAAKTDIATAGGLIVGVVVAIAAFSWIRRVVK